MFLFNAEHARIDNQILLVDIIAILVLLHTPIHPCMHACTSSYTVGLSNQSLQWINVSVHVHSTQMH